jgi:dGTPase
MLAFKRFYPAIDDFRDGFSRDRDRIIHCSSFRRLEYKTQVFINHEGDYFRTRLTHSLEVAQIARTLCRELGLNETLAEAIALSHDLGHTPFGHVGGDELDRLLKEDGFINGFEHNFQSFRVLTKLEKRYKNFDGLNLTYATLDGVLKHSLPYKKSFLPKDVIENFNLDYHPSFEAIIVDFADSIAYTSADIDDGIKYNLISFDDLKEQDLIKRAKFYVDKEGIKSSEHLFRHRLVASLIRVLVEDFIKNSKNFISSYKSAIPLCLKFKSDIKLGIGYSKEMAKEHKELIELLFKILYKHHKIVKNMYAGKECVKALYKAFMEEENLLPFNTKELLEKRAKHRVVADYIASMTDRYALKSYKEIYGV